MYSFSKQLNLSTDFIVSSRAVAFMAIFDNQMSSLKHTGFQKHEKRYSLGNLAIYSYYNSYSLEGEHILIEEVKEE